MQGLSSGFFTRDLLWWACRRKFLVEPRVYGAPVVQSSSASCPASALPCHRCVGNSLHMGTPQQGCSTWAAGTSIPGCPCLWSTPAQQLKKEHSSVTTSTHKKTQQGTHFTGSPTLDRSRLTPCLIRLQRGDVKLESAPTGLPFSPCFLWPGSSGPTNFPQRPNMFINVIVG